MTSEVYDLTGAKDFPFPHPVRYPRQLTVEVRPGGVVPPTEYEVIGYGPRATGATVRWPGAPGGSAEAQLVITRFVEPERVTEFSDDEGVTARALNAEFDNAYRALVDFSASLVGRVDSILDTELAPRLDELLPVMVPPVIDELLPPLVEAEVQPYVDEAEAWARQAQYISLGDQIGVGPLQVPTNEMLASGAGAPFALLVASIASLPVLREVPLPEGRTINVSEYVPGSGLGGGVLRYKSSLPKTEHDGVLVFSDTVPWSGAAEDLDDFRRGVGESDPTGAGCFVRETRAVYSLSDAGTEVDAEVAQTIQALDKRLDQGQRVIVPSGSFTCSDAYVDRLQLEGASKLSTLKAGPGAARVIDFGRHAEDWNFYSIKNLAFDGNGKQSDGVRFNDKTPGLEEFGGRWSFRYCKFTNAKRGAFHEKGNIGNRYRDCSFKNNDFGLYLMSPSGGEVMHTGATYMEGGEVSGSALAGIYVNDSQEGTGQHTFNNVIIEDNPGFGVFMDLNGKVPYSGVVFDNVWLESNATSPSVTIGGQTYTPRNIRLDNVPAVEFRNMYLSNIELNNSKAVASNCRIDDAQGQGLRLFVDEDSALVCDNLFMMGAVGPVPFVRSIAFQGRSSNSTNLSVRGPLAVGYSAISGRALYNETFSGDGPWGFVGTVSRNATKVSDGVISASCAELTIDSGQQLVFNKRSAPTPGKWVVWGVHAKLMSGSLTRSEIGYDHLFGAVYLRPGQWVRSYGLQKIGDSVAENGLFFSNSSGSPATVRIADMYAAEFDTFEEAIEFCNSRIAVRD